MLLVHKIHEGADGLSEISRLDKRRVPDMQKRFDAGAMVSELL